MNKTIKGLDIEKVLFFDIEVVRSQDKLDIDSKEFELFQKKMRNRDTDELPTDEQTIDLYNRKAGLRMCFNKIVCISCGAVRDGQLYIKSYTGTEEEIINAFYKKCMEFDYLAGYNVLYYDLPMIQINAIRYNGIEEIPERFSTSGKKPWNMDRIVELMDVVKGTHFTNASLDEVCFHLNVPSSKEGGIDGSQVSDVYYKEGVERISAYCDRDVFATVNVFRKLVGEEMFADYVDINTIQGQDGLEETPVLKAILNRGKILAKEYKELERVAKELDTKEIPNYKRIIQAALSKEEEDYGVKEIALFEKIDNLCKPKTNK
jgi:predicted PolB exonuclease-like 3'-5' exonuclease